MNLKGKSYSDKYRIVANLISKGYLIHGGESQFNEFDPHFIRGGNRGEYGYGFYFCNEAYKPINYGDYMYAVKENSLNLCDLNGLKGNPLEELYRRQEEAQNGLKMARNEDEYEHYQYLVMRLKLLSQERAYLKLFENGMKECRDAKDAYKYALCYAPGDYHPINLASLFIKIGYDGIIAENQYVIFNIPKLNKNMEEIELNENYAFLDKIISESIDRFVLKEYENREYTEK